MSKGDTIVVVCTAPGMIRGGRANPAIREYPLGDWTREQLAEVATDPRCSVVLGRLLDVADVVGLFDGADEAPRAKGGKRV